MDTVVTALRSALDDQDGTLVLTDPAVLDAARTDKSGWTAPGGPVAVVEARTVEQVQATLRTCTALGVPVVPRGAGTGLAGGANGTEGTVVLSVARMNRIVGVSTEDEFAIVEPGVLNGDLNAAVAEHGLRFAPDPASAAIASVGGNIATNAGGLRCVKYGVTREAVLGLDVVLADGRLVSTGHRTVKGVTGLDLTALLVGSEGTLGVIVGATVRLVPIPAGEPATLGAVFPSVESAARAAALVVTGADRPSTVELLDAAALEGIAAYLGPDVIAQTVGSTAAGEVFLLVEYDGPGATEAALAAAPCLQSEGGTVHLAASAEERERLLTIRRSFHPAMEARGRVLIEDVAVPRSRLAEMFARVEAIGEQYGIAIPTVAHAGDGNLHPNFVFAGDEVPPHVWQAADAMFRAAIELGGTLTGEHGVGVLKRRWIGDELGDDVLELQRGIRRVFDPAGILNPGKVF
ncbi:FAD-binding oxidoreductase [Curtobacterium sp. MCBA15_008]|uniref:FAD-binding oxidoreductase n=1 Tax=Curtobacterium sp. MCBA15_008 TaxID=1898736 RepID=UPI0008DD2774|nr:FAD-linked oxidase C-terminal domain-containing protein [Curtobacterium sp. MCBA15_008]OII14390.1 FAD-linked oxidase [Curtobacterium sp. MCBA15_008]